MVKALINLSRLDKTKYKKNVTKIIQQLETIVNDIERAPFPPAVGDKVETLRKLNFVNVYIKLRNIFIIQADEMGELREKNSDLIRATPFYKQLHTLHRTMNTILQTSKEIYKPLFPFLNASERAFLESPMQGTAPMVRTESTISVLNSLREATTAFLTENSDFVTKDASSDESFVLGLEDPESETETLETGSATSSSTPSDSEDEGFETEEEDDEEFILGSGEELKEIEEAKAIEEARKAAEARAAEDARQAAEAKAAEEARKAEEARAAEDARQAAEAKAAEEARQAAEAKAAEEARQAGEARAAEEARQAEEARKAAEAKAAEEARKAEEAKAAEEARKAAEAKAAEEARKAAEAKAAEEARKAAEAKAAEEARKAAEAKAAEEARKAEEAKAAEEARKAAEAKAAVKKEIDLTKTVKYIDYLEQLTTKIDILVDESAHTLKQANKVIKYAGKKHDNAIPYSKADKETFADIYKKAEETKVKISQSLEQIKLIKTAIKEIDTVLEKIDSNKHIAVIFSQAGKQTFTNEDLQSKRNELKAQLNNYKLVFKALQNNLKGTNLKIQEETSSLDKLDDYINKGKKSEESRLVNVSFENGRENVLVTAATEEDEVKIEKMASTELTYIQTKSSTVYRRQEGQDEEIFITKEDGTKKAISKYVVTAFEAFYSHYLRHGSSTEVNAYGTKQLPIHTKSPRALNTLLACAKVLNIKEKDLLVNFKGKELTEEEIKNITKDFSDKGVNLDQRKLYLDIKDLAQYNYNITEKLDADTPDNLAVQHDALKLRNLRAEAKPERPKYYGQGRQAMGTLFSQAINKEPEKIAQKGKKLTNDLEQQLEDKPSSSANFSKK